MKEPATELEEFVAAVDKSVRCLEEITVERPPYHDITDQWCTDELNSVLALNHRRRLHRPAFESIEKGATLAIQKVLLMEALSLMDETIFHGFLRRNEWGLQAAVQELLADVSVVEADVAQAA